MSSVSVSFSFPVKVLPINECNWHPFSIVPFVNTDHIFSSSLIILFFINYFMFMNMTLLFNCPGLQTHCCLVLNNIVAT